MRELEEYIDIKGINHFAKWFNQLNGPAAAKITVYIARVQQGNFSRVESVGQGVFEFGSDLMKHHRRFVFDNVANARIS